MTQRRQTLAIVLLILIPAIIVFGVYLAFLIRSAPKVTVPDIQFFSTAGPPIKFAPAPESVVAALQPVQPSRIANAAPSPIHLLTDGRIMMVDYPYCRLFDLDGNQTGTIELEIPPDGLYEAAGLEPSKYEWVAAEPLVRDFAITDSGNVWILMYQDPTGGQPSFDPGLLVKWDVTGRAVSVEEIGSLFAPLMYLYNNGPSIEWHLSSDNERLLVSSNLGGFLLIEPGASPKIGIFRAVGSYVYMQDSHLENSSIYAFDRTSRIVKYDLHGSIDWKWLENTSDLFQPSPAWSNFVNYGTFAGFGILPDGDAIFPVPSGIAWIDKDSGLARMLGDSNSAAALRDQMQQYESMFECVQSDDGWMIFPLIHRQYGSTGPGYFTTDRDFSFIKSIPLIPAPDVQESSESAESTVSPESVLLQAGDIAYPEIVGGDFHPIPGGYRTVDQTELRVLTTDGNLVVKSVLDRINPPNGRYQQIKACRVDSKGNFYLLGPGSASSSPAAGYASSSPRNPFSTSSFRSFLQQPNGWFVQVVDPDGNYIRKYDELGMDLFGTPLNPQEVMVDSADRLWVIGRDRFYVIDSDGNLARIFERRGAPYVRATQGAGSGMPTQDTPRGYTIVRTSDPFARGNDPERPIVLDAGEFSDIVLGQGPARSLFYVADNSSNQVVAYDWSGSERGSLDLSSIPVQQEYRIVTDSDGYFYVLDPPTGTLHAYTPLLEHSADIQLDSFPGSNWGNWNLTTLTVPSCNRCWINESGQLVLFINETRELLVYDIKMGLRSQRVNDR